MKKRRTLQNFEQLLLTNKVERCSGQFHSILESVRANDNVPAILTVRSEHAFPSRHIIIDGNHRAVAHACLKRPIRYFVIRSQKDIDKILEVEARGGFSGFPHRLFLTGDKSLKTLVHEAVVAAAHDMKARTAQAVALEFDAEERRLTSSKSSTVKQEQIRHEIERHTLVPINGKMSWQPNHRRSPETNDESDGNADWLDRESPVSTFRGNNTRTEPKHPSDGEVNAWFNAMYKRFGSKWGRKEFPCAYSEFAVICSQEEGRGLTIASNLQRAGLLERVRVGEIETEGFYPNGKPIMKRITYWRFTL